MIVSVTLQFHPKPPAPGEAIDESILDASIQYNGPKELVIEQLKAAITSTHASPYVPNLSVNSDDKEVNAEIMREAANAISPPKPA